MGSSDLEGQQSPPELSGGFSSCGGEGTRCVAVRLPCCPSQVGEQPQPACGSSCFLITLGRW